MKGKGVAGRLVFGEIDAPNCDEHAQMGQDGRDSSTKANPIEGVANSAGHGPLCLVEPTAPRALVNTM